jgi:hypothetical protein
MTAYVAITEAQTDPGAPGTSELWKQWRDNPLAIAEGSTDAPYNQAAWHPYDGVTVGDGNDGLIYDFAVTGSVASVITPDFEDGYEYQFWMDRVSATNLGASTLLIELYRTTDAAYGTALGIVSAGGGSENFSGLVTVFRPRLSFVGVVVQSNLVSTSSFGGFTGTSFTGACVRNAQKRDRARFSWTTGSFDLGKIFMYRRRVFS